MHPKKMKKYFTRHEFFNAVVHGIGGMGIGVLIASPLTFPHPVRWGVVLLAISAAGHLYAQQNKD